MSIAASLFNQPPDISDTIGNFARQAQAGAVNVLAALAVVLVGWGIALLLARLVRALLRAPKLNAAVRELIDPNASGQPDPATLASWTTFWLILGVALLIALGVLGFDLAGSVTNLLGQIVPRIIAAAILFVLGALVALIFGGLTRRFFETAGLRGGRFKGQIVTGVLTGFAVLVALEQLGFAAQFVMAVGIVAVAAAGLAIGLAFGLGCRELARDFVVEYLRSFDEEGPKRPV